MPISAPFARVLAAGRPQFNARVVEAKRRTPSFDPEAFAAFLQSGVDGVVAAVDAVAPDRTTAVAVIAYEMALALVAQGHAGPNARQRFVDRVWIELAPLLAKRVAEAPGEVLAALNNAAFNLGKISERCGEAWLSHMQALAGQADSVPQLLALGQVLAWRSGAAHLRASALATADQLPEALALAAFGAEGQTSWAAVREKWLVNPWWSPQRGTGQAPQGQEIGAFTGFGGSFPQPPEVRPCTEGFWVKSADRYSLLMADVWGAVLHPATAEEFEQPAFASGARAPWRKGTALGFDYGEVELGLPMERLTIVQNEHTVAVTSPFTHAVRLLPLR